MAGKRHLALRHLRIEADAAAAGVVARRYSGFLKPQLPPFVVRGQAGDTEHVLGSLQPMRLPELGRAERCGVEVPEKMVTEARPGSEAHADSDIDILSREIDQGVLRLQ